MAPYGANVSHTASEVDVNTPGVSQKIERRLFDRRYDASSEADRSAVPSTRVYYATNLLHSQLQWTQTMHAASSNAETSQPSPDSCVSSQPAYFDVIADLNQPFAKTLDDEIQRHLSR